MTKNVESEPWRGLPGEVADLIEPELPAVIAEILETIGREVPEYARPLEGDFGRGLRTGVGEALLQFVALVRNPEAGRGQGRQVYRALGRGELRQGRTLDSLQSAYRVGARVAWRRISAAGRSAGLDAEVLSQLAESIFAYIDELSADSVEGYAEAQSELVDARRRHRQDLADLLVAEPAPEEGELRAAVRAAEWPLPRTVAAIACPEAELGRLTRRLPPEALGATVDDLGCILMPDPSGPGRGSALAAAVGDGPAASLGPSGRPADLSASWSLARRALRAALAGALQPTGLVVADEHLGELLLFEGRDIGRRIIARRLSPFETLTAGSRRRMLETALAYVRHQGSARGMAESLHIHPQTARYRIARLRELLGPQLDDPDARLELEVALRLAAAPARQGPEDDVPDR